MSNNQMVPDAMEFYRGEVQKQKQKNTKVSPVAAWALIVVTFSLTTLMLFGVGKLFFWDRYNADPFYIQQFDALRQRVAAEPDNVENQVNLGWAYFQKGELNQALIHFERATALNDKYFPAFFHQGLTYMQMEKYELAAKAFTTAVALAPRDHVSQMNLGVAYARQNQTEKALEALKRAYVLQPGSVAILLELGNVYEQMEDYDSARKQYEEALAFDPSNKTITAALKKLER